MNLIDKITSSEAVVVTAGSTYLDIDAYACCVALAELLRLQGENAIAYSTATCNYSVCKSLINEGDIAKRFPSDFCEEKAEYIIVDVSDPEFLKNSVPLERVVAVYDHHAGFEEYWKSRLGHNSHIEFIGAAATLIFLEWKKSGLLYKMKQTTALLLIAAILDNTLNLTSSNTTSADTEAYEELCKKANVGEEWRAYYFSQVQASVEEDLKNALFNDIKTVGNNDILPSRIAQISVWDTEGIFAGLSEIRQWFAESSDSWMINIIDIKHRCSYFVCDDKHNQTVIERIFGVRFESDIAKAPVSYLRKEIIKKACFND